MIMKSVKIIFIVVEIAAIVCVLSLAFSTSAESYMGHWFRAAFISLFSLLAVTMQREQQAIEWDEDE